MKQRILSLLAVLCLMSSLTLPALAAESATATTLRLTSTEGTVTLTNQNGKSLSQREDMKLYNGYTVTTDAASYAYISLDDTKAVKLDASSSAQVKKNGKQLEVLLKSGNLFFNVTAPLKSDETLNIRTSTMVTGIRGTAGAITQSAVYLLDGAVTVYTIDTATGQQYSTPLAAGQLAITNSSTGIPSTGTFAPQDLPAVAGTEVAKDPILQEKIAQESQLDVAEIVRTAPEKQSQEQAAQQMAAEKLASAAAAQPPVKTEAAPPAKSGQGSTESSGNGGTSGGSGSSGGNDNPGGNDDSGDTGSTLPPPLSNESVLSGSADHSDIQAALNQSGIEVVRLTTTDPVNLPAGLTIPTGKTLAVGGGGLTLPAGQVLTINGTLQLATGTALSVTGTVNLNAGGTVENKGRLSLSAQGTWNHLGQLIAQNGGIVLLLGNGFHMTGGIVHSEDGPALSASASVTVTFTGGLITSATQPTVVSSQISFTGADARAEYYSVLRAAKGDSLYLLGTGFADVISAIGDTGTIYVTDQMWANETATIENSQDITLAFDGASPSLLYGGMLTVNGSLTLTGSGTMDFGNSGSLSFSGSATLAPNSVTIKADRDGFCAPLPTGYQVVSSDGGYVLAPSAATGSERSDTPADITPDP